MLKDKKYLLYLREQRCIFSSKKANDAESVIAHHISGGGMGLKRPDNETLPMLQTFHRLIHEKGEISMYRLHLPDDVLKQAMVDYAKARYEEWLNEQT